jgi:hypothetical protein
MGVCPICNGTEFYKQKGRRSLRFRCKKCMKDRTAARYDRLRAEGKCYDCQGPVEEGHVLCEKCCKDRSDYRTQNHEKALQQEAKCRLDRKLAAFNAYGGPICKCCGETEVSFLSIDHIDNNGAAHRKAIVEEQNWNTSSRSVNLALWLKKHNYPPGFQVLCMNCQFGKKLNGGVCPHEREKQPMLILVPTQAVSS